MTFSEKLVEKALAKGFSSVEEYEQYLVEKSYRGCYVKNREISIARLQREIERAQKKIAQLQKEIDEWG